MEISNILQGLLAPFTLAVESFAISSFGIWNRIETDICENYTYYERMLSRSRRNFSRLAVASLHRDRQRSWQRIRIQKELSLFDEQLSLVSKRRKYLLEYILVQITLCIIFLGIFLSGYIIIWHYYEVTELSSVEKITFCVSLFLTIVFVLFTPKIDYKAKQKRELLEKIREGEIQRKEKFILTMAKVWLFPARRRIKIVIWLTLIFLFWLTVTIGSQENLCIGKLCLNSWQLTPYSFVLTTFAVLQVILVWVVWEFFTLQQKTKDIRCNINLLNTHVRQLLA